MDHSEYDICLSYAGADRPLVTAVAEGLRSRGVRVFLDDFKRAEILGKDLVDYLDYVYRHAARWCVIFVSAAYARSVWTRLERRSAQARQLFEDEYIIPVRLDDTDLPGILPTVSGLDARTMTPDVLAELLADKAGNRSAAIAGVSAIAVTHNPHVLLGETTLTARSANLAELVSWSAGNGRRLRCLIGPGGQGKSALAWTMFERHAGPRLWHGLGLETDHLSALSASLRRLAELFAGGRLDLDAAMHELEKRATLVVLDGVEHLFGISERLSDLGSPSHRTIADLRVEALIRRLIGSPSIRVLLASRIMPAFVDDPAVASVVDRTDLRGITTEDSPSFWQALGLDGQVRDLLTATAALRGNPLLIRTAARWVLARGDGSDGIRRWLESNGDLLSDLQHRPAFQHAVLAEVIRDVTGPSRTMLAVLAASRRRLAESDWLGLADDSPSPMLQSAPAELTVLGLVHRGADGRYEMHDLIAEAVVRSADSALLNQIHNRLDDQYGRRFYLRGSAVPLEYDEDMPVATLADLERPIGYFLSLLDRSLAEDARNIFYQDLFNALRFSLGELRAMSALIAQYEAWSYADHGTAGHDFDQLHGELAIFDLRPDDAVGLLPDTRRTAEASRLRAEARNLLGDFADAYGDAQNACYLALARLCLAEAREITFWQMMSDVQPMESARATVDYALGLRTLSRVLLRAGFRRASLVAAVAGVDLVDDSGQTGISSMVHEQLGHVLLDFGAADGARQCAEIAERDASDMKVMEHIINARSLWLRIHAAEGEHEVVIGNAVELATTAARLGFAAVASDCLAVAARLGLDDTWLTAAGHFRYLRHETVAPSAREVDAADLRSELRELRPLHPHGHWMEWKWLRRWRTTPPALPETVALSVESLLGSWTMTANALAGDIGVQDGPSAVLQMLAEDESDQAALEQVSDHYRDGGPPEVYTAAAAGIPYHPTNARLRRTMLTAAERNGSQSDAAALLSAVAERHVAAAEIAHDLANASRRQGAYSWAAIRSAEGHRFLRTMFTRAAGDDIALVIGGVLDVRAESAADMPPEMAARHVARVLGGSPLIRLYDSDGPGMGSVVRVIGQAPTDQPPGTTAAMMAAINEEMMSSQSHPLHEGSSFFLAYAAFAYLVGHEIGPFVTPDSAVREEVAASLLSIEGHDEEIAKMVRYLRQLGD